MVLRLKSSSSYMRAYYVHLIICQVLGCVERIDGWFAVRMGGHGPCLARPFGRLAARALPGRGGGGTGSAWPPLRAGGLTGCRLETGVGAQVVPAPFSVQCIHVSVWTAHIPCMRVLTDHWPAFEKK